MKDKILKTLDQLDWRESQIVDLQIQGSNVTLCLEVDPALGTEIETKRHALETALKKLIEIKDLKIILTAETNTPPEAPKPQMRKPPVRENLKPPQIKHIIAVVSGKGGVGKSTTSVNLAISLQKLGLKVGIMDADIYGPSVPMMLGVPDHKAELNENKKLDTLKAHGLEIMSIGFLVDVDQPMIWRGPMVQSAIRQFLVDVDWPELDVLVVDMPPGTGDAQLTMAQKVPLSGAVIVSTPQDIALIDAKKAVHMFEETNVPILGLIENMSLFFCPKCGHETPLFGQGGAKEMAESLGIEILGTVGIDIDIRTSGDAGKPIALSKNYYEEIAENIKRKVS